MKQVAVLNQFALPRSEGGGTRHADLFGRLTGWQFIVIAGNRNHYTQATFGTADTRFRLIPVPRSSRGAISRAVGWLAYSMVALMRVVTLRRLDAVYGSSPHLLAPLAGLVAARLRRVPFILEVRDLWPESIVAVGAMRDGSATHRVLSAIERCLVKSADHIVAVTGGWEEHFASLGIDPTTTVSVITNGAETSDFAVSASRESLRDEYDITGFTGVFAGAHGPKDGIDLILDAAKELPEVNFLLVGDGPSKAMAVAHAGREGLCNVRFMEPVPKAELPRLLGACDVGIHAVTPLDVFLKGMSPNKLFDYLAAGLPIVSNAREALRGITIDGECGRLGGEHELASCLRDVVAAKHGKRDEWGANAISLMDLRYSRSSASLQLERVLDDAVRVAP